MNGIKAKNDCGRNENAFAFIFHECVQLNTCQLVSVANPKSFNVAHVGRLLLKKIKIHFHTNRKGVTVESDHFRIINKRSLFAGHQFGGIEHDE